ncbi:ZMYND10 [Lepeophtheirus salmonis]|uniref:ZMYND10 n=1 Tax=Lepeophtheirus salmonis TaxID=72036 RepID=A0A7R8CD36_LEPSM|nr:ZMYND10 [Lepeophtheirus salmonis]CAF2777210.1 ZMYND10 [Lepeophtheirus salmonis]
MKGPRLDALKVKDMYFMWMKTLLNYVYVHSKERNSPRLKGIFESSTEIEIAINGYNGTQDLESIGSAFWLKSVAKTLESLNVQAAIEANAGIEEFVQLWKERVLPIILKESDLKTSFSIYMILFFEANVSNLLETVFLFDGASATSLDDSVIDLTDYIMRQLTKVCSPCERQ